MVFEPFLSQKGRRLGPVSTEVRLIVYSLKRPSLLVSGSDSELHLRASLGDTWSPGYKPTQFWGAPGCQRIISPIGMGFQTFSKIIYVLVGQQSKALWVLNEVLPKIALAFSTNKILSSLQGWCCLFQPFMQKIEFIIIMNTFYNKV